MHPRSGRWVRPLLTRRRAETAAYCVAHGLAYATDRGNADEAYVRTAIRRYVVPAWEEALPGAVVGAGRAAAVAAEAAEVIDEVVAEAWARCGVSRCACRPSGGRGSCGVLGRAAQRTLRPHSSGTSSHASRRPRRGASGARTSWWRRRRLLTRPGSGDVPLGGGWILVKEYDRVRVTKAPGRERQRPRGRRGRSPADAGTASVPPGIGGVEGHPDLGGVGRTRAGARSPLRGLPGRSVRLRGP